MIPIKLEIQGLYSYKEKQTVDFSQLTAAGLFGIFGAVGSGKSSILEAVLLALYGSTERLSDRGEKNSMVNLQSEQLLINFEFRAGKNNTSTYLARYAAKRNPRNFEDVKPAEHTFYEKKGDQFEPLSQRAEEIVGMKKEHFKQTVIIPQGKFREFIDLTPGPRAEMMKELFGLERFDLAGKTGTLLKSLRENKIRLETQLLALESYTTAVLEEKETLIQAIALKTEQEEKACLRAVSDFQKQEALQAKHRQLQVFLKEWGQLEEKLPEIETNKQIWKDFLKAKTHLKPVWEQTNDLIKELEKYKVSVVDCTRFRDNFIREIEVLEEEEKVLKDKANKKSEREGKIRDLKKVLEIQALTADLKVATELLEKLQPQVEAKINSQKELEAKIKNLEESAEKITTPDTSRLAELKGAARDWSLWENQLSKAKEELHQASSAGKAMELEISQLQNQLPERETDFESWINKQRQRIKNLEAEKEKLLQKKGLAAHVHLLHEGEPCPLCGSTEHPHPTMADMDGLGLPEKSLEIEKARSALDEFSRIAQKLSEQKIRLENHLANYSSKKGEADALQLQLDTLITELKTKDITSKEDLTGFIQNTDNAISRKENLLREIKEWRKKLEAEKSALENEQQALREGEQKILGLNSTLASKRDEIHDSIFCRPFFEKSAEYIELTIHNVQRDIEQTEDLLNGKQKVLQETRGKQATNLANLKNFTESVAKTESKITSLEEEFSGLMESNGFTDRAALIDLFHHSLDADKVDAEIRQYENRRSIVHSRIEELQQEAGVVDFQDDLFAQLQLLVQEKKEALASIKKEFTLLDQDIKESKKRLEEKEKLAKEYSHLENRESYLKELERLFKGSGFVKYVSSIYLKELCATANLRFMKLTKNSLNLEIDDNNTFWVIDYLNGGKKRLLKTLSGGQTFQASLCLALALAEKVKSLNQADQSFFFLDEGFGALDRNSLRVVFETLKALRHENRIVGIISHVEELQQEIEVFAKIDLDPERGSQVGYSF